MNNDTDKLRAELQAKMQTMTDELYSQLGISESMLSGNSSVSAEIHSATDVMDARIHGFLAGQQYESDRHRDVSDKFINNVRTKVAEKFDLKTDAEIDAFFIGMEESARDNQEALEKRDKMLRDTVAELCEAKRLLKMAVEDFAVYGALKDLSLEQRIQNPDWRRFNRVFDILNHQWRYADETMKLIGDDVGER